MKSSTKWIIALVGVAIVGVGAYVLIKKYYSPAAIAKSAIKLGAKKFLEQAQPVVSLQKSTKYVLVGN